MKHKYKLALAVLMSLGFNSFGQSTVQINDSYFQPNQTYNWTNNNTYVLDGPCFVDEGSVLNIQAGTVIQFTTPNEITKPSALIITRGAKIIAEGTKDAPIIFTSVNDNPSDPNDQIDPHTKNQLWGGLVILGKGRTMKNGSTVVPMEGLPSDEPKGVYGMPAGQEDNNDSSGVLRYVSIRHGGSQIVSGSELNGLTLAGVGSKTKLEYIEVYANSDDGIEFFGGAPNLKHAVVAFVEDDSYDWDDVYTGKGQFWFSIQRSDVADMGYELDGTTPDDATPYSNGTVYNATHIGTGATAAGNPIALLLRAGTAGTIANSIFAETKGKGIEVQDKAAGVNDSYQKLINGELKIQNNIFWMTGSTSSLNDIIRISSTAQETDAATLKAHLEVNNNKVANPMFLSVSRATDNGLYPVPAIASVDVNTNLAAYPNDGFFTPVNYKGAFAPGDTSDFWLKGWTALWQNGHINSQVALGIDEFSEELSSFNIYPNPTKGIINVSYTVKASKDLTLTVYNAIGEEIVNQRNSFSAGSYIQTLNLSHLKPGTYFLKFGEQGKSVTKTIVVD